MPEASDLAARDGGGTTLRSFADREDAVRYARGEES
jgi:hypothetical protein